jgi:histidyl-tRNA synthetase
VFDLSLARGLDYYTGAIFEAVFTNSSKDEELSGVGSIAAGGRYDDLVGMFSNGKKIPCVGISLGVERIFSILARQLEKQGKVTRASDVDVFVIGVGDGALSERMKICTELWDNDIKVRCLSRGRLMFEGGIHVQGETEVTATVQFV